MHENLKGVDGFPAHSHIEYVTKETTWCLTVNSNKGSGSYSF